ncbi:hypothetical protein P9112_003142 [Eukaryota sp. TZLM1-RC]
MSSTFLDVGIVNFIRKWLPQVTKQVAPIIRLMHGKFRRLHWTDTHEFYLVQIKRLIAEDMLFTIPPVVNLVFVDCDAFDSTVGASIWKQIEPFKDPGQSACLAEFYSTHSKTGSRCSKSLTLFSSCLPKVVSKTTSKKAPDYNHRSSKPYLHAHRFKDEQKSHKVASHLFEFLIDILHTKGKGNRHEISNSTAARHPYRQPFGPFKPQRVSSMYNTDRIGETEPERSFMEDFNTYEKVLLIQDKCSLNLPLFEAWSCRIKSKKKRAIGSQDTPFNNSTLNSRLDFYLKPKHNVVIPQSLVKNTLNFLHKFPQNGHPSKTENILRDSKNYSTSSKIMV